MGSVRCACGLLVWLCWMRVEAEVQQEPVRVAAVGDVLFGRYLERPRPAGPIYSPVSRAAQPFAQVAAVLQAADLAFANLETPVLAEPAPLRVYRTLTFRADPARLPALRQAGFTVLSLANNHTGNLGARGAAETRRHVDAAGLLGVGAGGAAAQAQAALETPRRGQRVVWLARTLWQNQRTDDDDTRPKTRAGAVAYVHHRDFFQEVPPAVAALKRGGADHVIVSLHWGEEGAASAGTWQRRAAHALIDAGASLVLGHHPHVLQEIERYGGGLIAYSLGNFLFDNPARAQRETLILQATLLPQRQATAGPKGAAARVGAVALWPVWIDETQSGRQPTLATGATLQRLQQRLRALTRGVPELSILTDAPPPPLRAANEVQAAPNEVLVVADGAQGR